MQQLFALFNTLLASALPIALGAALLWGVLSVLLSPCHLATIPLVVGFVSERGADTPRSRAALLAASFAVGMLLSLAVLGSIVVLAGHALLRYRSYANHGAALLLVVAALHLLELVTLPGFAPRAPSRKGLLAALMAGLFIGVGLGPCTLGFVAPVFALAFGASSAHPLAGWAILLAFAVGHASVVGVAGASTSLVQRYLAWTGRSRRALLLKKACGVLVLLGASLLVYSA